MSRGRLNQMVLSVMLLVGAGALQACTAGAEPAAGGQIDHLMLRCQSRFLSPGGEGPVGKEGRMLGLKYWNLPPVVRPGQHVESRLAWETLSGNPNAVVFATIIGDWAPDQPIGKMYHGFLGRPGKQFEMEFEFTAPSKPGLYRIRWIFPMAFKPITCFYSQEHRGANNPGDAWWSEVTFIVQPEDQCRKRRCP